MKTQIGKLITGDFQENTMTIEIVGQDVELQAGKYAVMPINEYNKVVNGVENSTNKALNLQNVINCAFDDATLLAGFKALFGSDWKSTWDDNSKIQEMKSIINGGTMPCRPMQNWINCALVLQKHCL